jgi:predicted amidohydrolase YtcJ
MASDVHQSGFQVCLHALDEKAIEAACSAIEEALKRFPKPTTGIVIEHCAVCPVFATRLFTLGIVVVAAVVHLLQR